MQLTLLSLIAISFVIAGPALAQEAAEGRPPSHCIALAENTPGFEVIRTASTDVARAVDYRSAVPPETVRISYIDHSMFLIQTPGGLSVVTDYNGFIGLQWLHRPNGTYPRRRDDEPRPRHALDRRAGPANPQRWLGKSGQGR